jgi:hypothetical protein
MGYNVTKTGVFWLLVLLLFRLCLHTQNRKIKIRMRKKSVETEKKEEELL